MPCRCLFPVLVALLYVPCQGYGQAVNPGALVDAEALTWQFQPAASFSALTNAAAYDGVDALGIAANPAEASVLETTVTGPALVTWYWRRTQAGGGNPSVGLHFLYDGHRVADHEEKQLWEKVVIQIPSGPHTLQWRVPAAITDPSARAAVDLVTVYPNTILPEAFAVNDPDGVWLRTELGTAWHISFSDAHDGGTAAEARPEQRDQTTTLRRLLSGPLLVSWWWRIQGNDGNELRAKLQETKPDSTAVLAHWDVTFETPWQNVAAVVPAGWHLLTWHYGYGDFPGNGPVSPTAAGRLDRFVNVAVTPTAVLGMPGQTWNFGGAWGVSASSADTVVPGSVTPANLPAGGNAWLESSFTGPALLRWSQQITQGPFAAMQVSMDGAPASSAVRGSLLLFLEWSQCHLAVPAGTHTVRWTISNPGFDDASQAVRFDSPVILLPLAANIRTALGAPAAEFYENGTPASQIVANAPNGPEGNTSVRLSGTNTPLLTAVGPRLISYYHRRRGGGPFEFLRETVGGLMNVPVLSPPEWKKRSFFVADTVAIAWDTVVSDGSLFELDGFSMDAPPASVSTFLARSGLNWTVPEGAAVARVADASMPAPAGEVLFLMPDPASPVRAGATGPGMLEVEVTDRFLAPGGWAGSLGLVVTANNSAMARIEEDLPDGKRFRFVVPQGPQNLAMICPTAVAVTRLTFASRAESAITEFVREGVEGAGMTFAVSNPEGISVTGAPSGRRILTLMPFFAQPELRSTVTGPGTLSFDWNVFGAGLSPARFQFGTPPVERAEGRPGWNRVRVAIPPGPQELRWGIPGANMADWLILDHFQWEPAPQATAAPAGIFASAARTAGPLWRENRGAPEETLVAPWDLRAASRSPVTFQTTGPGIFVCEARLRMSHRLPHFSYENGTAQMEWQRDGVPVQRLLASEEWLPVAIPVAGGTHILSAGVVLDIGSGGGEDLMLPATMEFCNAALLPLRTAAEVALPGVNWLPDATGRVTAAKRTTVRGDSILWHLQPSYEEGAPPHPVRPQLTAEITGPGTLEWESSHEGALISLGHGATVRDLQDYMPGLLPFMPTHQLVLTAGLHRLTWMQPESNVFPFISPPLGLTMTLRWSPGPDSPLAVVVPPPFQEPIHFVSDGGWEPAPFDLATPWQLVRTRLPAPARISFMLPPAAWFPVWTVQGDAGFDDAASRLNYAGVGFAPTGSWLDFLGLLGERGGQIGPFARSLAGRVSASSAGEAAETFNAWAFRMGVVPDPLNDPDHDGLSSLTESALGTDPGRAEPAAWQIVTGASPRARFLWPPFVPEGVTRTIETSPDLIQWTAVEPAVDAGVAEVPLTPPAKFVRMRVSQ